MPALSADATREALPRGTRLGDFVIDAIRSEGGFALMHRAHHAATLAPVAVKVLRRALSFHGNAVERFHREVEALARILHPNVVVALAHGDVADGRPWMAMPWIEGADLRDHLARVGALSLEQTLAIVLPLAAALDHVHHHGLVHRDVKAENVMLRMPELVPVLVDFGVARDNAPRAAAALTTHSVLGTPCSMAPEQILGEEVDARTDVYGLGVLIFQMTTGALPFRSTNLQELLEMHLTAPPPRPSSLAPLPEDLDALVMRCLAKDPADRPSSASAVASELAAVLEQRPRALCAIYVEARLDPAMTEPDDATLDDRDAAITLTARILGAEGAIDVHPNAVLVTLAGEPSRARALAERLSAALTARAGRSPSVRVALTVHSATSRDALRAAATWAAPATEEGAFATLAVAHGNPAAARGLVRLA